MLSLERIDDGVYTVTIPADAPWFEGHFPTAPVLPGVVQLGLVKQAASLDAGRPLRIASVERLRLRHPVGPTDKLEIKLSGSTRFVIRRDGRKVSEGALSFA